MPDELDKDFWDRLVLHPGSPPLARTADERIVLAIDALLPNPSDASARARARNRVFTLTAPATPIAPAPAAAGGQGSRRGRRTASGPIRKQRAWHWATLAAALLLVLSSAVVWLIGVSDKGGNDRVIPAVSEQSGNVPMRGIDPGRTNAAPGPGVYSTPQEAWSYQVKGIIRTSPLVVDGVVYFGQSADSPASPGSILAVRASDGSLIWTLPTQHGLTATFLLDDDILYAVDDNGVIYAVDAQTGTEVWSESLRDDQPYSLTWYGAPLISSGTLVFSTGSLLGVAASNDAVFVARPADEWIEGDPHVYGISPSDGSILWDVSGFPGQSSQSLFALSVTDGSLLWSHAGPPAYLGPAYSDGVVYYGEIGPTALVALDSETGAQRWRTVLTEGKAWDGTSSPAVADGAVLVGLNSTASGTLVSVDKSTGAEQWRVPLFSGSQYLSMQSGIAVVGEEAIALGNGAIAGVDLSSRAVLWHVVLSIEMMMQPMPVVADGTILQVTLDPSNEHGAIVALTTPPDSS